MINIFTSIENEKSWKKIDIENISEKVIASVEKKLKIKENKEISIVFTNDDFVKNLNSQYRGKNKFTNVLSFAFDDEEFENFMLGEIFLAYNFIKNEAQEQNKTFENHLTHMILHGILHLLGYDHIEDSEAEAMENLEKEILNQMKIDNPYQY